MARAWLISRLGQEVEEEGEGEDDSGELPPD